MWEFGGHGCLVWLVVWRDSYAGSHRPAASLGGCAFGVPTGVPAELVCRGGGRLGAARLSGGGYARRAAARGREQVIDGSGDERTPAVISGVTQHASAITAARAPSMHCRLATLQAEAKVLALRKKQQMANFERAQRAAEDKEKESADAEEQAA